MVTDTIRETILRENLTGPDGPAHIVLGLSGGPDSVCLFFALNQLKDQLKLILHPVHLNHGFRPGEAEEDQAYAEELCASLGYRCRTRFRDCPAYSRETGMTPEEAGRRLRYRFFFETAKELAAEGVPENRIFVAVAQNRNDQAETVMMRILRGTGPDGLAAMEYRTDPRNGFPVIRPLLDADRRDIEAFCDEYGLAPRRDRTNQDPDYAVRNRIRLELFPYLETHFNPAVSEALVRLAALAREDRLFLEEKADAFLEREAVTGEKALPEDFSPASGPGSGTTGAPAAGETEREAFPARLPGDFSVEAWRREPSAARRRILKRWLEKVGLEQDLTMSHLTAAEKLLMTGRTGSQIRLPGGYGVAVEYGRAGILKYPSKGGRPELPGEREEEGGREKEAEREREKERQKSPEPLPAEFSACSGGEKLTLRTRLPGDWIALKGTGRKKIQDLFVDTKIPRRDRDRILLLCRGQEVLWVLGREVAGELAGPEKSRYGASCSIGPELAEQVRIFVEEHKKI